MLPATALLAALSSASPDVQLPPPDARGCHAAWLRLADRRPPLRLPRGLCVRDARALRLEEGALAVALLVDLPRAPSRRTVFVYRVAGRRLAPRFLASGLPGREVLAIARAPGEALDDLLVETRDAAGRVEPLRCGFAGFPLRCRPAGSTEGGETP